MDIADARNVVGTACHPVSSLPFIRSHRLLQGDPNNAGGAGIFRLFRLVSVVKPHSVVRALHRWSPNLSEDNADGTALPSDWNADGTALPSDRCSLLSVHVFGWGCSLLVPRLSQREVCASLCRGGVELERAGGTSASLRIPAATMIDPPSLSGMREDVGQPPLSSDGAPSGREYSWPGYTTTVQQPNRHCTINMI